jgi:hypothetical protein
MQVGVRDLSSASLAEFLDTGAAVPGLDATDMLPGGNAYVVTLRTARAGQSFRGRVYLGGYTEGGNGPTGAIATPVAVAGTAFVTSIGTTMGANGLTFSVLSRPSELTVLTKDVTHPDGTHTITTHSRAARAGGLTDVIAVEARNTIWDSQRRRTGPGSASTLLRGPEFRRTLLPAN